MGFLLLAILCTSSIALMFKVSETRGMNRYALTTANYVTACLVSGTLLLLLGIPGLGGDVAVGWSDLVDELAHGPRQETSIDEAGTLLWALCVGAAAGALFFLGFLYYQLGVREHGAGLAGATIKLGVIVPMALSLMVWQEWPSPWEWGGILLALAALALVNIPILLGRTPREEPLVTPPPHSSGPPPVPPPPATAAATTTQRVPLGRYTLVLLFLFGGMAEFSNKVFETYGLLGVERVVDQLRGSLTFLFVTFFVAFCFSLAWTWKKRMPVRRRDLLLGVAVGVPNLFSSTFLILSLDTVPAAAAFPAFGAGSILLINLVGVLYFKERLGRREWFAIGLTLMAIALLGLGQR